MALFWILKKVTRENHIMYKFKNHNMSTVIAHLGVSLGKKYVLICTKINYIFKWQHILAAALQKTFCAMFLSPGHEGLFGQIKRRFNTTVVKNPISLLNLKRHQRP